jgi:hypothetical protein
MTTLNKKRMKKIIVLLFFMVNYSFAQSSKIDSLVAIIVDANVVSGYTKGINGIVSEEYQVYQGLVRLCTSEDLMSLCKHQNACVRCYAFLALLNTNGRLAEEIIASANSDNEKITLINGCFGQKITVSDFMKSRGRQIESSFAFGY